MLRVAHFELVDRGPRELRIAVQIVRIEDASHVVQRVSGYAHNLRFGAPNQRQSRHHRSPQIIERDADNTGFVARLVEGRTEAIRSPRTPVRSEQDKLL
jgi:hypothetical protein